MSKRCSFEKDERLSRIKIINQLFNSGNSLSLFPLKIHWMEVNENLNFPVQVLINASKKTIKKASKRNLITRKIKEAYRLKKHILYKDLRSLNKSIVLAYIYIGQEIVSYKEIEEKLSNSFKLILKELK
jgi:ribonuclease P protein component